MEFTGFPKIENIGKLNMTITQKLHGSNAHVLIKKVDEYGEYDMMYGRPNQGKFLKVNDVEYAIYVGSRTKWITPEDDNFGFAKFVYENSAEFIEKLGEGHHFGEWCGPKINSGEGFEEKTFVLFNHRKFPEGRPLPKQVKVVPVLYSGRVSLEMVDSVMEDLRVNGSKISPGFMNVEGIVIDVGGVRYKKVFKSEETAWKSAKRPDNSNKVEVDASPYLQPIRLEKILSRDSKYVEQYPETLGEICRVYMQDLIDEGQITGTADEIKSLRKAIAGQVFSFVRDVVGGNE